MANTSVPGPTISDLNFCALSFASGFHYLELHLCSPSSNLASETEGLKVRNGDGSEANVIEAREKKIISLHKCLRDADVPDHLCSHLSPLQTLNCRAASLTSRHAAVSLSIQPPDTKVLLCCAPPLKLQSEHFVSKRKLPSRKVWNVLRHILFSSNLHSNTFTSQESKGKAPSYIVLWNRCASKTLIFVDLL